MLLPLDLPATREGWYEFLAQRCDQQLETARRTVEVLGRTHDDAEMTLARWNTVTLSVLNATAAATVIRQAHPDAELRERAELAEQEASALGFSLRQDRGLYEALEAVDADVLDPAASRMLAMSLREFRRAGVDLDAGRRRELRELGERCTTLTQQFERNLNRDVRAVAVRPEQLDGLPDEYVAAHPPGRDGSVVITTEYPDALPFLSLASDAEARLSVATAFESRGWPENDAVLRELFELRARRARLLGFDGWADYDASVKMIGSGTAIRQFIDQLTLAAAPVAEREARELSQRMHQDHPHRAQLTWADVPYYTEVLRRERFGVDGREVSRYLSCDKVVAGLLEVTAELFGLEYVAVPGAPAWHPDVITVDVLGDGTLLGRVHLDLHPRPGKFTHDAHFPLVRGVEGLQLPQSVLLCNVPRDALQHDDVVALFHEFGHLLHSVLGGHVPWARDSGVATERDFVEAPSQMLEEWARDPAVLRRFATDRDGNPISYDLVTRMRDADSFGRGCFVVQDLAWAEMAYTMHEEIPKDLTACAHAALARHTPVAPVPGTHLHTSFGHLADERYGSGYYAYLWSLVIAKDLFSAFDPDDLQAPGPARRFRDVVLAAGGSRDATDLVESFLGRPVRTEAFDRWLNGSVPETGRPVAHPAR
jgi:Zn-dependent oligopeptidase